MRTLVIGRNGQLATALGRMSSPDQEVICLGRAELGALDVDSVLTAIAANAPDVVVNAAAFTAVDQAEQDSEAAHVLNALGAEAVARACARRDLPLIHLSTDYVFDGTAARPYIESDPTGPINVYGRTKLEGEQRVTAVLDRHVILRTSWLFAPYGRNFLRTMLTLAESRDEVGVVDDQRGNPTYAPDLAEVVLAIGRRLSNDPSADVWGVFHAAGSETATWYGFACAIFAEAEAAGLPRPRVRALTTAEYPTAARRPANSTLSCDALRAVYGLSLWGYSNAVAVSILALAQETPPTGPIG